MTGGLFRLATSSYITAVGRLLVAAAADVTDGAVYGRELGQLECRADMCGRCIARDRCARPANWRQMAAVT